MEVKPSLEDLRKVIHHYYPQAPVNEEHVFEGFSETEEHQRLVAARIRAGTDNGPWRTLLDRIRARFPECELHNRAYYLSTGGYDAAYVAKLVLPTMAPDDDEHALGFMVSFLVPYYVIYRLRCFTLYWVTEPPDEDIDPNDFELEQKVAYDEFSSDFTEEEAPYAREIAAAIEDVFEGYAPMPHEIGKTVIPEVWVSGYDCGNATVFECLFSNHWY